MIYIGLRWLQGRKIYFVVESKETNDIYELRTDERIKIKNAEVRFRIAKNAKFIAPVKDYDSFVKEW